MIYRLCLLLFISSLVASAQAKVDTTGSKKAKDYKVIYSDKSSGNINKKYSTKTISPRVLEKVVAHQQNKKISTEMADLPDVREVKIINFGAKLEYATDAVSMKVIQSKPVAFEAKGEDFDKVVVERVIAVRKEDSVSVETINKFAKKQKREASKKEKAAQARK